MNLKFMKLGYISFIILFSLTIFHTNALAQQGCCSHHDGINYCHPSGMYMCNDGEFSPSCNCYFEPLDLEADTYLNSEEIEAISLEIEWLRTRLDESQQKNDQLTSTNLHLEKQLSFRNKIIGVFVSAAIVTVLFLLSRNRKRF